ncbi:RNA polymerase sigma-70 factor [Sunxiuqinia sp. sy24]|uniref:RNA polymerase sigma-70 factor n=1 Tax=Sunxiuqinia sp. sy24 TaxID=3461495 RepID=UPI0040468212
MDESGGNSKLNFKKFEQFFNENIHAAGLIAYRYVSDKQLVEDILQDAFITIWDKRSQIYNSDAELRKYLFVTVRNKTISYLRSIKVKQIEIDNALASMCLQEEAKLYTDEELALKVSKAIDKLPKRCQEIFKLAYLNDKSYNEIADTLTISKNTVKTQMVIAYRILRVELKEIYLNMLFILTNWKKRE